MKIDHSQLSQGLPEKNPQTAPPSPPVGIAEEPIFANDTFLITPTTVKEKEIFATITSPNKLYSNYSGTLKDRVIPIPDNFRLSTKNPIIDAAYHMALEEARLNVRPDGAFSAGAMWPGVWTRDISYAIDLGLAIAMPQNAIKSLDAKLNGNRIIQDTGTGGSWPVSTDRMIWAKAAWEAYLATGDRAFLQRSYDAIKTSAKEDRLVAYDPKSGLIRGESSFLDWQTQSYPEWVEPVDIAQTRALGTNLVHYKAYDVLAQMARSLKKPTDEIEKYEKWRDDLKESINRELWLPGKGYYSAFLYPDLDNHPAEQIDTLGEALSILHGVASPSQTARVLESVPVVDYGPPVIYPQQPHTGPYHNKAIWPFVTAYWTWAGAQAGNLDTVESGVAALTRSAALFLTHKENMVYNTGKAEGTAINSDRQLWSVAGYMGLIYRVFAGMKLDEGGMSFSPMMPEALGGHLRLENFKYREATLDIELKGVGNRIKEVILDGKPQALPFKVPTDLKGVHTLQIKVEQGPVGRGQNRLALNDRMEAPPPARNLQFFDGGPQHNVLVWQNTPGATYSIFRDGKHIGTTLNFFWYDWFARGKDTHIYHVVGRDKDYLYTQHSKPLAYIPNDAMKQYEAENSTITKGVVANNHPGYQGPGFVSEWGDPGAAVDFEVQVDKPGKYGIQFRYANGLGHVGGGNEAGIRSLYVDGQDIGTMLFPQRGRDGNSNWWSDWGDSNMMQVDLQPGKHKIRLVRNPEDTNMGTNNAVNLDAMRLIHLK